MKDVLFTIIMPTYNSEETIELALESIRMQDLPKEKIEILVIDGGSTDKTLEIAQKYEARILYNWKKFPEYAKRIGFAEARGKWIVMEDSDEVLTDKSQLRKRMEFFENNPQVYCMVADKFIPGKGCGIACSYINYFGDPFSYIVYNSSNSRIESNRKYLKEITENGHIFSYGKNDIMPIGDGGTTTIDIDKAKELFGEIYYTQEFAVSVFYNMVKETQLVGCIPDDNMIHYSVAEFRLYLNKLRFRVNTNLNDIEQSGYSVRAKGNNTLRNRKILFILYVMTIILPLVDSIRMVLKYRRPSLLLHFVYTYYVVIVLGIEVLKKILGLGRNNYKYGK